MSRALSADLVPLPARRKPQAEDSYEGLCTVCGNHGIFLHRHYSIRESYQCPQCGASLRYREQASVLIDLYSSTGADSFAELTKLDQFQELAIFEPGVSGPFRKYLIHQSGYLNSFFWEDVKPGDSREGVLCQDLMKLTFGDAVFDLVITSDIFEHVRHPLEGFREIARVLKPGGYHVFSIPVEHPMPPVTTFRVDTSGPEDKFLLPPRYHGDGKGGKSLVYTDFGEDMLRELECMGLPTTIIRGRGTNANLSRMLTFCSMKS